MSEPASTLKIIALEETDSTNSEALRLAQQDPKGGDFIVWAKRQSAGRGRHGRKWISPDGNLYLSVLKRRAGPPDSRAQASYVCALALYDVLATERELSGKIALKWPNDVLIDERKVAGILLESDSENGLVAGIGLNIAEHPAKTAYPATSLYACGLKSKDPDDFVKPIGQSITKWWDVWRDRGFERIRDTWMDHAACLHDRITVKLADRERTGIFRGIDIQGALLLETADGSLQSLTAGDVSIVRQKDRV